MEYRLEHDTMGEVRVPADCYWGAQTQRSFENFRIGTEKIPPEVIRAFAVVKLAAARANAQLGVLDARRAGAIETACHEILDGSLDGNFPLAVWQTGSGSKWALISEGGRMLGLDVTQIPLDKDRIYRNLDVGNPIIVVVGPGDFTTDGHFLVLTGRDGDKITLNDPNSPTNSQKSWDYDTLAGQIQSLWVLRRAG